MSSLVLRRSISSVAKQSSKTNALKTPVNEYLNIFADAGAAEFVAAAGSLTSIPPSQGLPEVIVTGRANSGKSTLFNAVVGRKDLLHTSKKAGRTRALNFFRVGAEPGKLILVDAPGYGRRGRQEWGELFSTYLAERKELRRVYILFNAKHGLNTTDIAMLESLHAQCLASAGTRFTLQSIITKADAVPPSQVATIIPEMRKQIWKAAPTCLPPIITSACMQPMFGIEETRLNILEACGLLKKTKK